MRADEMPPALREALAGMVNASALAQEAAEDLAAATGWTPAATLANLQALIDARCWKKIPRCFNGWGVGICALPNHHVGGCSPIPDMSKKEAP